MGRSWVEAENPRYSPGSVALRNRHHPRRRVIQYSRDSNGLIERPRRTGCPAFAGHDELRHAFQKRLFRGRDRVGGSDVHPDAVEPQPE